MNDQGGEAPQSADSQNGSAAADPLVAQLFDQRYLIHSICGSGASGVTYKAHDSVLDRVVAIKIIHANLLQDPRAVERFRSEAITTTSLKHPNIVQVHKQGVAQDGRLYMVMDCLDGESLAELIAKNGKLNFDLFFEIFAQVIEGLRYAHEQGIVHRDIKPSNIMLVREASGTKAFLVDFGIAKCIEQNNAQGSTQTGLLLGSSSYMSPEQCKGAKIDTRSDIYSLACVMIESLMGQSPFKGMSALDVMYQHLNSSLSNLGFLKALPAPLSKILKKCIEKEPDNRYQSVKELQADFSAAGEMKDTLQRSTDKHKPVLPALLASAALAGLLVFCATANKEHNKPEAFQKKIQTSADRVGIPPKADDLEWLLKKYDKQPNAAESKLLILRRWLAERGSKASKFDRISVYNRCCDLLNSMNRKAEAADCCDKVKRIAESLNPSDPYADGSITLLLDVYRITGQALEGVRVADRILAKYPELARRNAWELMSHRAYCLEDAAKTREAIASFKTADEAIPEGELSMQQNSVRHDLIKLLASTGDIDGCKKYEDECLKCISGPDEQSLIASEYVTIAGQFAASNHNLEAIQRLEKARELAPKNNIVLLNTIQTSCINNYRTLKNYVKAIELENELLKNPQDWYERTRILLEAAGDYRRIGDEANSRKSAEEAIRVARDNLGKKLTNAAAERPIILAIFNYRDALNSQNKTAEALSFLQNWISSAQRLLPDPLFLAELYRSRGEEYLALDLPDKALEDLQAARAMLRNWQPKEPDTYLLVDLITEEAGCKGKQRKHADKLQYAKEALDELKKVEPDEARKLGLQIKIAYALASQNQDTESQKVLQQTFDECKQKYTSAGEGHLDELRQISQAYSALNEYRKAEEVCLYALQVSRKLDERLTDSERVLYLCLASALKNQNKLDAALNAYEKALQLNEQLNALDHITLGILWDLQDVWTIKKSYNQAIRYLLTYIERAPVQYKGKAYRDLARVYQQKGDELKAKSTLLDGWKKLEGQTEDKCFARIFVDRTLCHFFSKAAKPNEWTIYYKDALNCASDLQNSANKSYPAEAYQELAGILSDDKQFSEALKYVSLSVSFYKQCPDSFDVQLSSARQEWLKTYKANADDSKLQMLLKESNL
jgi:serine/threonine protein kinase